MSDNIETTGASETHGAHDAYDDTVKGEILGYLQGALARYPRVPGEDLTAWFDRVIGEHVEAPEYWLTHALGMAEGADIDMLSDEFEAALARPEDPIDGAVDGSVPTTG